ncbi:MAG: MBL fold metallo-hydrolase, partial [SAR324 cluster bacterium]|nr:MBL fold metallo-hydrolase [SAR324 cluster bacterium]
MTQILPIPYNNENFAYYIPSQDPNLGILIDCGSYQVTNQIEALGLKVSHLLITHHHWDHVDGIDDFMANFPDVKLYHPSFVPTFKAVGEIITDGELIEIGEHTFKVMATPYHTRTSICYQLKEHLFVADSLFICSCGRMFEGRPKELHRAMQRFISFPDETIVHMGHDYAKVNIAFAKSVEPSNIEIDKLREKLEPQFGSISATTVGQEKKTNPFFRVQTPELSKLLDPDGI